MKRLLICRHAKSSWKDLSLADRDRPLNKRGKRDAPMMGKRLHQRGISPDAVITSPARRAAKTARHLAKAVHFSTSHIQVVESLYGASPWSIIEFLHTVDDSLATVMVVGHNPECTMLANLLGGLHVDNVPTCGVVALDFHIENWQHVKEGEGKLVFYDYPKRNPAL